MRIAIGAVSPDEVNTGHFGVSPGFVIVDRADDGATGAPEWRANPWTDEPIETRPPKIAKLLEDCDAILVRSIAREGLAQLSTRFTVLLATTTDIPAILAGLGDADLGGLRRYDTAAGKFVTPGGD